MTALTKFHGASKTCVSTMSNQFPTPGKSYVLILESTFTQPGLTQYQGLHPPCRRFFPINRYELRPVDTFVSPGGGSSTAFVSPFDASARLTLALRKTPSPTGRLRQSEFRTLTPDVARCRHQRKKHCVIFFFSRLFQFCVLSWKDVFFIMVSNQVQTLGKTPFRPTNFRRQNSNFQTMRHLSYNKKSCRVAIRLVVLISTSLSEI